MAILRSPAALMIVMVHLAICFALHRFALQTRNPFAPWHEVLVIYTFAATPPILRRASRVARRNESP